MIKARKLGIYFFQELNILAQYRHPSIISFIGFVPPGYLNQKLTLPMFAMEFARLGALGGLLVKMSKMNSTERMNALSPILRHRYAFIKQLKHFVGLKLVLNVVSWFQSANFLESRSVLNKSYFTFLSGLQSCL